MKIKTLEMLTLHIPFYTDYVTRHMQRALTHSEQIEIYRVELKITALSALWRKYGGRVRQLRSDHRTKPVCNHAGRQHRFRYSDVPV